jgi:hypothetical protein
MCLKTFNNVSTQNFFAGVPFIRRGMGPPDAENGLISSLLEIALIGYEAECQKNSTEDR